MDQIPKEGGEGLSKRQLGSPWTVWEKPQAEGVRNNENYQEGLFEVFTFDSLPEFALFWKSTPYSSISRFFYDYESRELKRCRLPSGEECTIEGLLVFRKGIHPKWEDPKNCMGCSLVVEIPGLTPRELDGIWSDLVTGLVGEQFDHSSHVNGLRMLDRLRKSEIVKIELWLSVGPQKLRLPPEVLESNRAIFDAIFKNFLHLLRKYWPAISENHIVYNDHYRANRV